MDDLSIADVLRYYAGKFNRSISVPESSGWNSVNCPFHGDEHASGRVNTDVNAFKCHGCHMSGDAIKLIEDNEKIGFGAACEFAREVLGASVGSLPSADDKPGKQKPLGRNRWKAILD